MATGSSMAASSVTRAVSLASVPDRDPFGWREGERILERAGAPNGRGDGRVMPSFEWCPD
jgi:hypothetical protein